RGVDQWRCSLGSSLSGRPVVRKKFGQPGDGISGDAGEDVLKPGEGIDTEYPVVAADGDTANSAFGGVVVDLQVSVLRVAGQRRPVLQGIARRPPLRALRQHFRLDLQQVVMQLVQKGQR